MGNYERGIYEPGDEVRVFDGSEDEDDAEGSRLPLLIVLALIVLFAFGGVVYFAYSQGVARGRGETPILTAAAGPEKVAPASPGGARVPYQGFKIYEQPAPPDDQADANTTAPAPSPAAAAKPAPAEKPAEKTAAMTPPPAKVEAQPAPKPAVKPAAPPQPSVATGTPRALGAALPAPPAPHVAAAPAAALPAAAPTGAYVLQIGAYKSQADADTSWRNYQARHGALLAGFAPNVQQVDLGEKGTWYRLRVGGFADKDGATATCDRLKADGGACFLSK